MDCFGPERMQSIYQEYTSGRTVLCICPDTSESITHISLVDKVSMIIAIFQTLHSFILMFTSARRSFPSLFYPWQSTMGMQASPPLPLLHVSGDSFARCGKPSKIWSDNSSNFIGASRELPPSPTVVDGIYLKFTKSSRNVKVGMSYSWRMDSFLPNGHLYVYLSINLC